MNQRIEWTPRAIKDAGHLDYQTFDRISARLRHFAATGQGDIKRLTGYGQPTWRLRVGDWRVRFTYVIEIEPETNSSVRVIQVL